MKMVVMSPPGPNLAQPSAIALGIFAQTHLSDAFFDFRFFYSFQVALGNVGELLVAVSVAPLTRLQENSELHHTCICDRSPK